MKRIITFLGIFLIGCLSISIAQVTVTNVTSSNSNTGVKATGDIIEITVEFSDSVDVNSGTPTIDLNSSATAQADYTGTGSGTRFLVFEYLIADDEYSDDLDYDLATSLTGDILASDAGGINLTLPAPAGVGSLKNNKNLVIDSRVRSITKVTSGLNPGTHSYSTAGTIIGIGVKYNFPVYVTGKPIIELNTENEGVYASYYSGSGSDSLIFRYTVANGDQTAYTDSLDYKAENSLNPNGGSITCPAGRDVNVILPEVSGGNSIIGADNIEIIVDAQKPRVQSVSATSAASNPLKVGDVATITVKFTEPVAITSTDALNDRVRLLLETGSTDTLLARGTSALNDIHTFTYTVSEGEESDDLNYKATSSLSLDGAGTIKDNLGNDAILTLPSTYSDSSLAFSDIVVDGISPTVVNITSSSSNKAYSPGDSVNIKFTFSEPVISSALTLDFTLNNGRTVTKLVDPDLANATTYSFYYKIDPADGAIADLDADALAINGLGTLTDTSLNTFNFDSLPKGATTTGSLSKNRNISIDKTAPQVLRVSSTVDSTYGIGKTVLIGVKFNEPVKVTGSPKFMLNPNDTSAFAVYSSGTSRDSLVFKYKVLEGHTNSNLDILHDTTTIDLSSGTLTDLAGNTEVAYDLPNIGSGNTIDDFNTVVIDGLKATIADISGAITTGGADGFANPNDVVTISLTFSEDVFITNTPRLLLETGKRDRYVDFSQMNGTNIAEFEYTVQVGDTTSILNVKNISSLIGGTIKDNLGNYVDRELDLAFLLTDNIIVDGIVPTIKNVTSTTRNGSYNQNDPNVEILLIFSEPVDITAPALTLNLNSTGTTTAYNGTTNDVDTLTLSYDILDGENADDLDYSTLVFNADAIKDKNGNSLSPGGIPTPGTTGSLSRNKSIIIDTEEPILDSISCTMDSAAYNIGDNVYFTLYFKKNVYVGGKPKIEMNLTGTPTDPYAYYYSGSGSKKLRFRYNVKENDVSADLNYTADNALTITAADSICDKAGNYFGLTLPVPNAGGMLWDDDDNIVIDGVKPYITDIISAFDVDNLGAGFGNEEDTIDIAVVFSEAIVLAGTPRLVLETGRVDRYIDYVDLTNDNTLNFKYGVMAGDEVTSLNVKNSRSLIGSIKDSAGNYAIKTLPMTGTDLVSDDILIDAVPPTVKKVTSTTTNGYKTENAVINIQVQFSDSMTAANTLNIELGEGIGSPILATGTVNVLNETLVNFEYTVVANDENTDLNYADVDALKGNATDIHGNPAILTLPALTSGNSLAKQKNIYVDAKAPSFLSVSSPNAIGEYGSGSSVYIKLKFDDRVRVSGKPRFKLNSGTDVYAYYYSGSGSNTLQFKYRVQETETTSGGNLAIASNIDFVSTGSITDYSGNENNYVIAGTLTGIEINENLKSANIQPATVTDIIDIENASEFKVDVYPNPVKNGEITLHLMGNDLSKDTEVHIYNVLGNKISSDKVNAIDKVVLKKDLEAGIYILTVRNGKDILNQRIMIE